MKKNEFLKALLVVVIFSLICFFIYHVLILRKSRSVDGRIVVDGKLKNSIVLTFDKYLSEIFETHSIKYCGDLDYENTYVVDSDSYSQSKSYSSLSEVRERLSSIVTERYFDSSLSAKFVEHGNKLYCLTKGSGSLDYKIGSVEITDIDSYADFINVKGYYYTVENDMNSSEKYSFEASILNNNGLWVIDSYSEV